MSHVPLRPVLVGLSQGKTFKPLEKVYNVLPPSEDSSQRSNGRGLGELPPLFFALDSHPAQNGSAFFSIGETRVSAAVSGPNPRVIQTQGNKQSKATQQKDTVVVTSASRLDATIELSIQFAPFATAAMANSENSVTDFLSEHLESVTAEEKASQENALLRALGESVMEALRSTIRTNNYPNATIEISVLILSYDCSLLFPAVINTVSLALMRANITTSDILAACVSYVVKLPTESKPYCCLALDDEELRRIKQSGGEVSSVTLAVLAQRGLIAYIETAGVHLTPPYDQQSLALAESACTAVAREMGNCIKL